MGNIAGERKKVNASERELGAIDYGRGAPGLVDETGRMPSRAGMTLMDSNLRRAIRGQ